MPLLITRPRHDSGTHWLYHWSRQIIDVATNRGIDVYDMSKSKANRKKILSYINKKSPETIVLNGHGNSSSVSGHSGNELINIHDASLFKGMDVFVRACDAGQVLGRLMVQHGADGFVGYKEKFIFPYDKDYMKDPLQDALAAPCLECSNQVGVSLLKGHTVKEAHEMSMKVYMKKLSQMMTSESMDTDLAWCLQWNMTHQVYFD
jgi:hypothetical protein